MNTVVCYKGLFPRKIIASFHPSPSLPLSLSPSLPPSLPRGPFATAMGHSWHPEHFVCTSCHKQLQNTMFVFEEESIFCESCYEKKFAKTCHSCRRPVVGVSGAAPVISGLVYHNSFMCNMYFVLHTHRHTLLLHNSCSLYEYSY